MNVVTYCSVKQVIARVYNMLNIQDEGRWGTFIEWCGECINLINVRNQYIEKVKEEVVNNHKVKLPCDLHGLLGVAYNGRRMKRIKSMVLSNIRDLDEMKAVESSLVTYMTYTQQENCLVFPFKKGKVHVYYLGLVYDEEGFPMIPDNEPYKNALESYIYYRIKQAQHYSGQISTNDFMYFANIKERKLDAARSYLSMPSYDEAIGIAVRSMRLYDSLLNFDGMDYGVEDTQRSM